MEMPCTYHDTHIIVASDFNVELGSMGVILCCLILQPVNHCGPELTVYRDKCKVDYSYNFLLFYHFSHDCIRCACQLIIRRMCM